MTTADPRGEGEVRLEVHADEREVLRGELGALMETVGALYRQVGRRWDPADASALTPDVALVVRAHGQLAGPAPWQLEGTADELEFLLGRLRAAAELALERGARPSPIHAAPMNAFDAEGTDFHLDILSVSDALLQRIAHGDSD